MAANSANRKQYWEPLVPVNQARAVSRMRDTFAS